MPPATPGSGRARFEGVDRLESYLASVERILALPGIGVHLPNHAVMGQVFERAERLADRRPVDPHPFVDPEDFRDSLERWRARAEKRLAEERASGSDG